jgi:predicted DNA-binding transcriptional regulator AlpA
LSHTITLSPANTRREDSPTRRESRRRRVPPGLLRRPNAAHYCSAGTSSWDRWSAAGLTPAPIRLGGAVYWSRRELRAWIDHGCPPRAEWEAIWKVMLSARRVK